MIKKVIFAGAVAFGLSATPSIAADDAVMCVQKTLNTLGFDAGVEDGLFGGSTARAAAAYQDSDVASANPWAQEALTKENTGAWCAGLTADHQDVLTKYDIEDGEYRGQLAGRCVIMTFDKDVREASMYESCFGELSQLGPTRSIVQNGSTISIDAATFELDQVGDRLSGRWTLGDYSQLLVVRRQ